MWWCFVHENVAFWKPWWIIFRKSRKISIEYIVLSEKLFTIHILMAPNKHECLWACYPYYRSFFLVNPDPLPERRRRERIHPKILWNPFWHLKSTSILLVFFWKPLPSVDAVFTCLSWNLLSKSPFSKYGKCEYNILLLRFLLSSSVQLVLWSNHSLLLFFTEYFVFILYSLSVRIFVDVFHFLVCLLILLYIPSSHHIYLFNHWQAQLLYFYESLTTWAATLSWYTTLRTSSILSFTFTSFSTR